MKVKRILGQPLLPLAALTAMLALGACAVPAVASAADSPKDSAAIRQLFGDFTDAFNRHDAQAVAALCTGNVDFIVIGGEDVRGRAAVAGHLQPLFAGRLKSVDRTASVQEIRFLRPDVAIVVATYETRGVTMPNGTPAPAAEGVYDWVVVRRGEQWHIALWREANLPAQAPPP